MVKPEDLSLILSAQKTDSCKLFSDPLVKCILCNYIYMHMCTQTHTHKHTKLKILRTFCRFCVCVYMCSVFYLTYTSNLSHSPSTFFNLLIILISHIYVILRVLCVSVLLFLTGTICVTSGWEYWLEPSGNTPRYTNRYCLSLSQKSSIVNGSTRRCTLWTHFWTGLFFPQFWDV